MENGPSSCRCAGSQGGRKISDERAQRKERLGMPEDVGQAALFLASDNAAWITSVILDVAGGSVLA